MQPGGDHAPANRETDSPPDHARNIHTLANFQVFFIDSRGFDVWA